MTALSVAVLGLASCGDDNKTVSVPGTPAGTYQVTVTGANSSGSASTTVTLTVK